MLTTAVRRLESKYTLGGVCGCKSSPWSFDAITPDGVTAIASGQLRVRPSPWKCLRVVRGGRGWNGRNERLPLCSLIGREVDAQIAVLREEVGAGRVRDAAGSAREPPGTPT